MPFSDIESSVIVCMLIDQTARAEDSVCPFMLKIHLLQPKTAEHMHKHKRGDKYFRRELTDQVHSVGKLIFACVHLHVLTGF